MIQQIAEIIKKGRTFLVTSHMRLDGDAVGSELALYEALCGAWGRKWWFTTRTGRRRCTRFCPTRGSS